MVAFSPINSCPSFNYPLSTHICNIFSTFYVSSIKSILPSCANVMEHNTCGYNINHLS
jgi:hypothetical protein